MSDAAKAQKLFQEQFRAEPVVITRAPGRIEFIGNHTDYNQGTVLGASIDRGVTVAARLRADGRFLFATEMGGALVELPARPITRQSGQSSWVNYALGVVVALEKRGLPPVPGLELAVTSDLPSGAGLSSSAALELATALALCALLKHPLSREEIVKASREAENTFVGVPCGILDQGVSGFGRKDHLVHIDCRGPVFSVIPMPVGVRFWIFNTHAKHALVDSLYATRHAECMEAAKALAGRLPGVASLADVSADQLQANRAAMGDAVFRRARHIVEEIGRVGAMVAALGAGDLRAAGALLFASHESSRVLFENSTSELDLLVDTLRGQRGVYGARLTGGGFGGAVMALTDESFDAAAADVVGRAFAAKVGQPPDVLRCATADGAETLRG